MVPYINRTIMAIFFDKSEWTKKEVRKWIKDNGLHEKGEISSEDADVWAYDHNDDPQLFINVIESIPDDDDTLTWFHDI